MLKNTFVYISILIIAFFIITCDSKKDNDTSNSDGDSSEINWEKYKGLTPYEGLTDVETGKIKCNGDNCCYKQCDGNQDVVCVTRDPLVIIASFATPLENCTSYVFPESFYAHDCFVPTAGIRGDADDSPDAGQPLSFLPNSPTEMRQIDCFLGRTSDGYSAIGDVTVGGCQFVYNGCGVPVSELYAWDVYGFYECTECVPTCANRECGSDGCYGSCGTCPSGQTCSAGGQCFSSEGGGTSCSTCLSNCRGLPGCCTGCGCLCEDECGGCIQ